MNSFFLSFFYQPRSAATQLTAIGLLHFAQILYRI